MTEYRITQASDVKREYVELVKDRAGFGCLSHYVIPTTDEVLEVHRHRAPNSPRSAHTHILSTIERSRESERKYADPHHYFPYFQISALVNPMVGMFFSHSDRGVPSEDGYWPLRTRQGTPLCLGIPNMIRNPQPTDEEIEQHVILLQNLGKRDRIIYNRFTPSRNRRTRHELENR